MFTQKHFERVATVLRDARLIATVLRDACPIAADTTDAMVIVDILVTDLADIFSESNTNFDRTRFYDVAKG